MITINEIRVGGYLGKDPEVKEFSNGGTLVKMSVGTTEKWKDKNGEVKTKTTWHTVEFNRDMSKIIQYLKKGTYVYVSGSLENKQWENQDGSKSYATVIRGAALKLFNKQEGKKQEESETVSSDAGGNDLPF